MAVGLGAACIAGTAFAAVEDTFPREPTRAEILRWLAGNSDLSPDTVVTMTDELVVAITSRDDGRGVGRSTRLSLREEVINPDAAAAWGGRSIQLDLDLDCARHRVILGTRRIYSRPNLQGAVRITRSDNNWAEVPVDTVIDDVARAACSSKPATQLAQVPPASDSTTVGAAQVAAAQAAPAKAALPEGAAIVSAPAETTPTQTAQTQTAQTQAAQTQAAQAQAAPAQLAAAEPAPARPAPPEAAAAVVEPPPAAPAPAPVKVAAAKPAKAAPKPKASPPPKPAVVSASPPAPAAPAAETAPPPAPAPVEVAATAPPAAEKPSEPAKVAAAEPPAVTVAIAAPPPTSVTIVGAQGAPEPAPEPSAPELKTQADPSVMVHNPFVDVPEPKPPTRPPARVASAAAPAQRPTDYAVQIAAAATADLAHDSWQALKARFPTLIGSKTFAAEPVEANGRTLYRALLLGFSSPTEAADLCKALRSQSVDCILRQLK